MSAPEPLPRFIANGPHGRAVVAEQHKSEVLYVMGVAIPQKSAQFEGWAVKLNDGAAELFEEVDAAIWRARVLAGTVEMR